ncbi:MAG: hypothetical protein AAF766_19860 [Cyanobacteria bacterium P01_D01_bin.14]
MIDRLISPAFGPLVRPCLLTDPPDLPSDLSFSQPPGEVVRVIVLGSPGGIRQTWHLLHNLRYVEVSQWGPVIEIPKNKLVIRPEQGEQMSILVKRL